MTGFTRTITPFALALALTLGACSGDADVDVDLDSMATDDTMNYTPADSGMPSNAGGGDTTSLLGEDTTAVIDADSAKAAVGNAATGVKNEGVEKLVEAQLMVSPGFSDVTVESEGDGAIVLKGTVGSAEEKAAAEAEAKKIVGVTSVRNNLTVK